MQHSIYLFFDKILTLWNSEVNKTILEQVKVAEGDYDYMLQFLRNKHYVYKICSRRVDCISFT